jgi:hypothetical protein
LGTTIHILILLWDKPYQAIFQVPNTKTLCQCPSCIQVLLRLPWRGKLFHNATIFQLLLALIIHIFCGIVHLTTPTIVLIMAICFKIQGQKEIDELGLRLQEMYQLHENTLNELQSLKSENEDLLEEKVWLTYQTRWVWFKFSSLIV